MHVRLLGATAALSGLLGLIPAGRTGPSSGSLQPVFSARSELVVLQVSVEDRHGASVTSLGSAAFSVLEDGLPQTVAVFNRVDAPATVGLLIDSSGSMRSVRDRVAAAAEAFVAESNPQDEVFAFTFADDVYEVLSSAEPFTNDGAKLRTGLLNAVAPRGRTALYDAVARGLAHADAGTNQRKALIIVSDGGDNASVIGYDEIIKRAQRSNALIYTVTVRDPLEPEADPRRLRTLAAHTGGGVFEPHRVADVPAVLQHIARDIRNMYTLGYVPAPDKAPGLRRVHVRVSAQAGGPFRVRTRQAYLDYNGS
jgi:VWFA-related protein